MEIKDTLQEFVTLKITKESLIALFLEIREPDAETNVNYDEVYWSISEKVSDIAGTCEVESLNELINGLVPDPNSL